MGGGRGIRGIVGNGIERVLTCPVASLGGPVQLVPFAGVGELTSGVGDGGGRVRQVESHVLGAGGVGGQATGVGGSRRG